MIHQYSSDYPAGTIVAGTTSTASVVDIKQWDGRRWRMVAVNVPAGGVSLDTKDAWLRGCGYARTGEWIKDDIFHYSAPIARV